MAKADGAVVDQGGGLEAAQLTVAPAGPQSAFRLRVVGCVGHFFVGVFGVLFFGIGLICPIRPIPLNLSLRSCARSGTS